MNTKLSGAQLVLVPIKQLGSNYFPWVENIRNRFIKYIDFYGTTYLPGTSDEGLTTTDDLFVTIKNAAGNTEIVRNLPLARLDYTQTLGVRQRIFSNISISNCTIECQNEDAIGKVAAFVFWYDLPEFTQKNSTTTLVTDSISIPLTTSVRYNQLPDAERMTGKRFRRILLGTPTTSPEGGACVTEKQLENIYITLCKGSYNVIENLPLMLLYQLAMLEKSEFQNIIFDFQSSYLTIGGANTIPNVGSTYVGKYVFLNLQYEK